MSTQLDRFVEVTDAILFMEDEFASPEFDTVRYALADETDPAWTEKVDDPEWWSRIPD